MESEHKNNHLRLKESFKINYVFENSLILKTISLDFEINLVHLKAQIVILKKINYKFSQ